jgi:hypothetical protein
MFYKKAHIFFVVSPLWIALISLQSFAQSEINSKVYEAKVNFKTSKGCKNNKARNDGDFTKAVNEAKLSLLNQRFASEAAAVTRDFDSNKDKFLNAIDEILINSKIASTCRKDTLIIDIRSSVNESKISSLLIGDNKAQISGPRSRVSAIFLARRQSSVRTFKDRALEASRSSAQVSASVIDEVDASSISYDESFAAESYSESGGSRLRRGDEIIWDVSTSNDLDTAVSQTFSSFGYRFIDISQVEAISDGKLSVDQFKSEFGSGDDLTSATKGSVFGVLKDKIPIFVISTIDIGVAEQNPVTSEAIVYVSVTAKAYQDDGLFYGTVASVEPQQFSATGPNQTVAETRALVKAARAASEEVVRQLYAASIY